MSPWSIAANDRGMAAGVLPRSRRLPYRHDHLLYLWLRRSPAVCEGKEAWRAEGSGWSRQGSCGQREGGGGGDGLVVEHTTLVPMSAYASITIGLFVGGLSHNGFWSFCLLSSGFLAELTVSVVEHRSILFFSTVDSYASFRWVCPSVLNCWFDLRIRPLIRNRSECLVINCHKNSCFYNFHFVVMPLQNLSMTVVRKLCAKFGNADQVILPSN